MMSAVTFIASRYASNNGAGFGCVAIRAESRLRIAVISACCSLRSKTISVLSMGAPLGLAGVGTASVTTMAGRPPISSLLRFKAPRSFRGFGLGFSIRAHLPTLRIASRNSAASRSILAASGSSCRSRAFAASRSNCAERLQKLRRSMDCTASAAVRWGSVFRVAMGCIFLLPVEKH